jgi:LysR family glycine cleavage system transcriptional activator
MRRRLPPLNSLRAFEAAARHASFANAADELCVTPGAISRQIKSLEAFLGKKLFGRSHRKVEPTPDGLDYSIAIRHALDSLQMATNRLVGSTENSLHVVCPVSFCSRWLMPKLAQFVDANPKLQVSVTTGRSILNPLATIIDADVSIEFRGNLDRVEGFEGELLLRCKFVPVTSPEVAQSLRTMDDLRNVRLLHSIHRPQAWAQWAAGAGIDLDTDGGMNFSSLSVAYQAAADGLGVAIGDLSLVISDLEAGRLVCPFGPIVEVDESYSLFYPKSLKGDRRVLAFRRWLSETAANCNDDEAWANYVPLPRKVEAAVD